MNDAGLQKFLSLEYLVDELSTTCTEVDFNICVSVASTIQET